jgi:hypothetical protein
VCPELDEPSALYQTRSEPLDVHRSVMIAARLRCSTAKSAHDPQLPLGLL